jgi:hypothetical protein
MRAATALAYDGEVARAALRPPVEQQRRARNEVGLADEMLAPPGELYDG